MKKIVVNKKEKEKVDYKRVFEKDFNTLCTSKSSWEVWSDFIILSACAISNNSFIGKDSPYYAAREKEYLTIIKKYPNHDDRITLSRLLSYVVCALDDNPEQDFLGELFMSFGLGSHWKGQFFTPYNISSIMSSMTMSTVDYENGVERKGYVTVCDPACGSGVTMIAAVNHMKKSKKYSFQRHAFFVGQDIDRTAGLMCYIQLSLLGCAGYVCIGDALSNPIVSSKSVFVPDEKENQEFWYFPFYYSDVWQFRMNIF